MEKVFYFIIILFVFNSCSGKKSPSDKKEVEVFAQEERIPVFQSILDTADVTGAILIYNFEDNKYYSNDFEWARRGQLPASTFKIPNSIIALERGLVENDSSILKWNGERRRMSIWERDLSFRDALQFSCVPCYQEIARSIGVQTMNQYLNQLDYKSMQVDSNTIDMFWLQGDSRITPFQQIDFLSRFYHGKLPISNRTERIMKRMLFVDEADTYKLSAKSGWSISNDINNGWYIGYVISQQGLYFFAINIEPNAQFDMSKFPMIRRKVAYDALREMDIVGL